MWEKKALTKPQPLGMIKTLRNLRLVGNFLKQIQGIYEKAIASIIVKG